MTKLLYMGDSYLKEFDAVVVMATNADIVLDRTAFCPRGGGLPADVGSIIRGTEGFGVDEVVKQGDDVVHHLQSSGLQVGDAIRGAIDWERRYAIMRMHTGMHALASMFNRRGGALITGNQVNVDRSRLDVNIEKLDRPLIEQVMEETNRELSKNKGVRIYYLPREEALRVPGMVKLAEAMPPNVAELRIVEIEGLDTQADGGPHVANTREIGRLVLAKVENKGKSNRRIYFRLEPERA
jgi:Ser-tRNA(Ala) deacylase AlaX